MQTGSWKRFTACVLATGALLAGCSNEAPAPKPKAAAAPDSRASGEADSVAGGVKVVLLELKRDGPDALMVRWQFRNDTGDKIEVTALSSAGMNPWRLSRGVAVRDASGTDYPLLEGASAPQAAKHDVFTFSARFAPRQVVDTWARVKAPPPEVQRVDVLLPTAAPIRGVPIAP